MMYKAIVKINQIPTEIISYNRWIEEGIAAGGKKDVVIIITGNPGIPSFYKEFAETLQSKLPSEVPIWIIGHTGATQLPENAPYSYPDRKTNAHLYDLHGNLQHKAEFIKTYVPPDARIHLIGHSIGAWFALHLMEDLGLANQVVKSYMLFPTLERMAVTRNGKMFVNYMLRLAPIIVFLSWIFTLFPYFLQLLLIRIFALYYRIPSKLNSTVLELLNPTALRSVFFLGKHEMMKVKELNETLVAQHKKKLFLYYGSTDGWTPIRYYEDLKAKFPDIDAHLCKRGFRHAFVLSNAVEVGKMIGDLINENLE